MKKRTKIWPAFVAGLLLMSLLQACLEEDAAFEAESSFSSQLAIGTVHVVDEAEYYFALDQGGTMYPGDTTDVRGYQAVEGQRAFIYFDWLGQKVAGYDYNARIYRIENILTKEVYRMPAEKSDSIGDDRINITNLWMGGGYLNIECQFYYNRSSSTEHLFSLVLNEDPEAASGNDDDYLLLEFRHNAYNDGQQYEKGKCLVSFWLDGVADLMSDKKGLVIRVNSINDGIKYETVSFAKDGTAG